MSAGQAAERFQVVGRDPGPWPRILGLIGLENGSPADLVVLREDASGAAGDWLAKAEQGAILIVEGQSPLGERLGFRAGPKRVRVQSVRDARRPQLRIVWERALDLPAFEVPEGARVFVREKWEGAPLMAGLRAGAGAVLWVAASPGPNGYERFPYLLHALTDLGLEAPFRSRRLWAFFDSSYRARVDLEYFAKRWREAGIAALHVAAWHFLDSGNDAYLRELIDACHRRAILVYAWLELPHVSEKFWAAHPEWREKTALLQDAHLDWRKLMNLANPDCRRAAAAEIRGLIEKFDWDGVNLAELYFESLEGVSNPARFTPMNDDVRREFRLAGGFDPLELFKSDSPKHHARNPEGARAFLDFRAGLARRIETEWIEEMETVRSAKPGLDLVLTHVDDYFDSGIRDAIGADAASVLPSLERHSFTFMVEDPATVWHLGPQRYEEIGRRYRSLTRRAGQLALDINVVERYQNVYPTKQQTGIELFQLVHQAVRSFPRLALYFENSILAPDLELLPAAAAAVSRAERVGRGLAITAETPAGVRWKGPALVDGRLWPGCDGSVVWVPAGRHVIEPAGQEPGVRLLDFNGDLKTAAVKTGGLEFAYESAARALAVIDRRPASLEIDGEQAAPQLLGGTGLRHVLRLPRGQHHVAISIE